MFSKPLGHGDQSAFDFSKEMLDGNPTGGMNIETIYFNPKRGYCVFEYLLCEESQSVNPFTSHPNKYWHKNKRKFITLFEIANKLEGRLYLVNYAKKNTKHADKVLLIRVDFLDENGIQEEEKLELTRSQFSEWITKFNKECLVR